MDGLLIACADVGSVAKGRFGWADSDGAQGTSPLALVEQVAKALKATRPVALGFECPVFVPFEEDEASLTKARLGEVADGKSRPWSAGAGCGALATGVVQMTWVLHQLRQRQEEALPAFLDWSRFASSNKGLLVWEAFVSGTSKGQGHTEDAALAVAAFASAMPRPVTQISTPRAISLAGMALLRSGWSTDLQLLAEPALVVKARSSRT